MSLALPATIAGVTAASAYLNAKYHVVKDLKTLYHLRQSTRSYEKAALAKRHSLWYPFEDQVNRLPPTEACVWSRDVGNLNWHQVYDLACQYAQFLLQLGVAPGELVALDCQNSVEFVVAWFGMLAVGAAPAMINYNLEGDALMHCLRLSEAKVLLVDDDEVVKAKLWAVKDKVEGELGMRIVVLDQETKSKIAAIPPTRPGDELREGVKGTDPSFLVYTSGTTGFPKAVVFDTARSWASIGSRAANLGVKVGPNAGRFYDPMPMYHGTGANVALMCITSGITLCVGKKFSVSRFWDEVRECGATAFVYVGETARYLLAQPESVRDKEHSVTMMFGNGLRPDVWTRFRDRFGIETISEFFNSSEGVFGLLNVCHGDFLATSVGHHGLILRTLLRNTFIPVEVDHATNDIARHPTHTPSLLTALSTSTADPTLGHATRLPYSTGGEILVNVPSERESGFAGYYKNPSATSKKFARDVLKQGDTYFRSGDALRRDDDGRWFFLDRLGDTFRWKSENVSTAEVAIALGSHPGVVEANVYGVLIPHHDGRAGCAAIYIHPAERATFDYAALLRHARQRLPRYAVPVFLRVVGEMSPMHNNKQNKVPLRNEGVDVEKVKQGVSPQDVLMWCPPGGKTYVEFGEREWEGLGAGKAKL